MSSQSVTPTKVLITCTDPGILPLGVQALLPENSPDNVFFVFFCHQLIFSFHWDPIFINGFISEKIILFQGFSKGGLTVSVGGGGGGGGESKC